MIWLSRWKTLITGLRRETYSLYFACRDPQCPWYVRLLTAGVVAYMLSPVDLIPNFIPILGLLDDLLIVPLGIFIVRRLIPAELMKRAELRAKEELESGRELPVVWVGTIAIFSSWLLVTWLFIRWLL